MRPSPQAPTRWPPLLALCAEETDDSDGASNNHDMIMNFIDSYHATGAKVCNADSICWICETDLEMPGTAPAEGARQC